MPTNINSQIQFLSQQFLNQHAHGDDVCGGPASSGTGASPRLGQLGQEVELSNEDALHLSDTVNEGTLYAGTYKYVKTLLTGTNTPARGLVAFWSDPENDVVSADPGTNNGGCIAGVFINSPGKGKFWWIQKDGVMTVKYKASTTKATPAACDLIICDPGDNVADALVGGNNLTVDQAKNILGTAQDAPVGGSYGRILGWQRYRNTP